MQEYRLCQRRGCGVNLLVRLAWLENTLKDCTTRLDDLANVPYDCMADEGSFGASVRRELSEQVEYLERQLRDVRIQIEDAKGTPEEAAERRRQRISGRLFAK